MEKIIGIPGWSLGENSFGVTKHYLDYISLFGQARILMPGEPYTKVDLLMLPGGMDMDASSYGGVPGYYNGSIDPHKQWFYDNRLAEYIEKGTPVFGICLGLQQLAVFFGGELVQNLHYHEQSANRWAKGHEITLTEAGLQLFKKKEKSKYEVNSHHHQALTISGKPVDLVPVALAHNNDDGTDPIVEGFVHRTLPVAAVQWHPEEWRDGLAANMIRMIMKRGEDLLKVPQAKLDLEEIK